MTRKIDFSFDDFPKSYQYESRRQKAATMLAVLKAELGSRPLSGIEVLDVGCATGLVARFLSQSVRSVTGIDVLPESIAIAKKENPGPNIRYLDFDGKKMPFSDAAFDAAVLNHVLAYVPLAGQTDFVAEIFRVLRPGGLLYLGHANSLYCVFMKGVNVVLKRDLIPLLEKHGTVSEYTGRLLTDPAAFAMPQNFFSRVLSPVLKAAPGFLRGLAAAMAPVFVLAARKR